ncbi:MAG: hypothetical protein ACLUGP_08190 [Faecalibacterium prausnitzii]
MNAYAEMKKRHQEEVNALPMYWAFSDEQFDQQLKRLGLTRNDTGRLCKTFGGGFCLASDAQMIADTLRGHRREMEEAISADETGDGFIKDMFLSELSNHEYTYTCEVEETVEACALRWSRSKTTSGSDTGLRWRQSELRESGWLFILRRLFNGN